MSRAPDAAELPVQLGDVVDDKFRVERVLGAGGMGVVVEATHLLLRQRVALKFIRREVARDQTNVARFLREARACVQLRNEHIARIMDVGTLADDTPFIVMEYLEGRTADELLRQDGPLPASTAVSYVLQACVGMAEAHALGIVHRDLKPHNLFVTATPAGRPLVKILDFGISKAALAGAEDHALTDSRTIVGSPAYMAPEQMESARDVDARADIWSLGAILYALVSGHPPFRGQTLLQLCARVETGEREPLDEALAVPANVVAAIDACLRRAPSARPPDLAELAGLLAASTPGGDELAAEVAATLRTTRRASVAETPTPTPTPRPAPSAPRPAGRPLDTTVASSDDSLDGATPTPPRSPSRRRGWLAAVGALAIVAAIAWYATRDRPVRAAGEARDDAHDDARDDARDDAHDDATTAMPVVPIDAALPDAPPLVDAGVRRGPTPRPGDRDGRRPSEPEVNPPPPPIKPPAIDAGPGDPPRHPRDRRN